MLTKKKKYGSIKQLKSIFLYGRSIMISAKQQVAVILCCAFLMPYPAHALVPVFDFMESVPLFKQVSSTTKSLSNIKSQLSELTTTLEKLGKGINITKFMDNLENINDSIKGLSGDVKKAINITTNINDTARDKVDEAISSVVGGQKELANQLVDKVNTLIENEKTADNVKKITQTAEKEIDQDETNKAKEIALAMMNEHRQKSEEMTQELNDTIEDAAYVINKSADVSHKRLVDLQNALLSRKLKADQMKKESVQSKETALMHQEQKASDFGADMIEQAKNKYNQEYKNKLVDGYNNYEKTVLAYFDGNATKEEVRQNGEILKEQAAGMNVPTDKDLIKNYKEELRDIQRETAELTADIEEMLDGKNEVSL